MGPPHCSTLFCQPAQRFHTRSRSVELRSRERPDLTFPFILCLIDPCLQLGYSLCVCLYQACQLFLCLVGVGFLHFINRTEISPLASACAIRFLLRCENQRITLQ